MCSSICDGESLARTGDAEQRLMRRAGHDACRQLRNGLRLVAGGRVVGDEFKHPGKVGSGQRRRQRGGCANLATDEHRFTQMPGLNLRRSIR